jgi:hypothetical protein
MRGEKLKHVVVFVNFLLSYAKSLQLTSIMLSSCGNGGPKRQASNSIRNIT